MINQIDRTSGHINWAPPSMRGIERSAVTHGMVLGYHDRAGNVAIMYDGVSVFSAVMSGPVDIGRFYNTFFMNGSYFTGTKLNIRYR